MAKIELSEGGMTKMLMTQRRRRSGNVTVTGTPDDTMIFTPYIKDALLNLNANSIPVTLQHEPRSAVFSQLFIQMRRSSGEGQSWNNPAPLRAPTPSRLSPPGSLPPSPTRHSGGAGAVSFLLKAEIPDASESKRYNCGSLETESQLPRFYCCDT